MLFDGLPIFELAIDNVDEGMYAIALVQNPATMINWQKFSEQNKPLACSVIDKEKRRICTCICRADFPIYRYDELGREFYVVFKPDTIEKMSRKFLKDGMQCEINIEHTDAYINGFELVQLFIKNTEKGLNPVGFENVEEGSLFGVYEITDDNLWKAIEDGTFKSVSLEGYFTYEEIKEPAISTIEELLEALIQ